jgi:hypothetical protein
MRTPDLNAFVSKLLSMAVVSAAVLLAGCGNSGGSDAAAPAGTVLPVVGSTTGNPVVTPKSGVPQHVFIVMLENKSYSETFAATPPSPYLGTTLPSMGVLLTQYHGTGHVSLDNYISMVGGQSPNTLTGSDCQIYQDWIGTTTPDADGQVTGLGCIYPAAIKTIANQLQDAGYAWRGYMEDMGNDATRDSGTACAHPTINSQDGTQTAEAADQYATRHNPFMYYHAVIDDDANCKAHVVPLTALQADLQSIVTTANYTFITPNLCDDGHDTGCKNGDPGGFTSIDSFLSKWVPIITNSPAFKQDGLLIVTFDEAEVSGSAADATSCCNEPTGPNSVAPGLTGAGGGRIGAVLVSPFIKPGTTSDVPYNHYATLKSIENLFGLPYIGYANQAGLVAFGPDVYNNNK